MVLNVAFIPICLVKAVQDDIKNCSHLIESHCIKKIFSSVTKKNLYKYLEAAVRRGRRVAKRLGALFRSLGRRQNIFLADSGSRKKSYFSNDRAIKKGGKGLAIKEKRMNFFFLRPKL